MISSEESSMIQNTKKKDGESTENGFTINDYLEHVGQLGRYQAVIMIACNFLFFVPAYQSLLMVFATHSPPWTCNEITNSTINNNSSSVCANNGASNKIYVEGQPGFNLRCSLARSEWKYTLPVSDSIVSEV